MKVGVLGAGAFHDYWKLAFVQYNIDYDVIPAKNVLSLDVSLQNYSHIIDCLDPNGTISNYEAYCSELDALRSAIGNQCQTVKYYYLSSANVYQPSRLPICELSQIKQSSENPYVRNKIYTENRLKNVFNYFSIFRLPALWSTPTDRRSASFFSDLLNARLNSVRLPQRDGDCDIFSFMYYQDAANMVVSGLLTESRTVTNITSNLWASRTFLKCYPNHPPNFDSRIGIRLVSIHMPPRKPTKSIFDYI